MSGRTVLYHLDRCPYCEMVRLALNLEQVPWESRPVDPDDRSEVEELSGRRQVPVLVEGDQIITDSSAILQHLAGREGSRLIPPGRRDQALMALLVGHVDSRLGPLCRTLIRGEEATPGAASELEAELLALDRLLDRGEFLFGHHPTLADARAGGWLIRLEKSRGLAVPADSPQVDRWLGKIRRASGEPSLASGSGTT